MNHTYPDVKESGEALPEITDNLSMPYFGYYGQGHLGEIYHRVMEDGAIRIVDLSAGGIKESGKD